MGSVDSVPLVAHVKAAVQAIAGDTEGAEETMINFAETCPVVSQVTSLVQAIDGDEEGAGPGRLKRSLGKG